MEDLFSKPFREITKTKNRSIYEFVLNDKNLDKATVDSFGEEWLAFHQFDQDELHRLGDEYFDIIDESMIGPASRVLEVGCGSGRFLKYLRSRAGLLVGVDPSQALLAADELLGRDEKVILVRASANDLPFADETFDFVYSIGVLHHIPDTFKAMEGCISKLKRGGYFFTYLYYDLDNRGFLFRLLFKASSLIRKVVSSLPARLKKWVCNILAVICYLPFVYTCRLAKKLGVKESIRRKIPLFGYENKSFYIIRNDALDRFGTPLEQRFSKEEIRSMMERAGLEEITFSNQIPYWHAVGRKK